jgi:hypothetical protein
MFTYALEVLWLSISSSDTWILLHYVHLRARCLWNNSPGFSSAVGMIQQHFLWSTVPPVSIDKMQGHYIPDNTHHCSSRTFRVTAGWQTAQRWPLFQSSATRGRTGSDLWRLSDKIMLCKCSPRAHIISELSFLVACWVLQELCRLCKEVPLFAVLYGNVPRRYRRWNIMLYWREGQKFRGSARQRFLSSCYASLSSVISYIFLRPVHRNVGNDNDMTDLDSDKRFGMNGLG